MDKWKWLNPLALPINLLGLPLDIRDWRRDREWKLQCTKEDAERRTQEEARSRAFRDIMSVIKKLNPDWELDGTAIFFKRQTDKGVVFGLIDGCDYGDCGGFCVSIYIYPGRIELDLFSKAYGRPMNFESVEIFRAQYALDSLEGKCLQDYRAQVKVWVVMIDRHEAEKDARSRQEKECKDFFKDLIRKA